MRLRVVVGSYLCIAIRQPRVQLLYTLERAVTLRIDPLKLEQQVGLANGSHAASIAIRRGRLGRPGSEAPVTGH